MHVFLSHQHALLCSLIESLAGICRNFGDNELSGTIPDMSQLTGLTTV